MVHPHNRQEPAGARTADHRVIGDFVADLPGLDSSGVVHGLFDLVADDASLGMVVFQVAGVTWEPYDRSAVHAYREYIRTLASIAMLIVYTSISANNNRLGGSGARIRTVNLAVNSRLLYR